MYEYRAPALLDSASLTQQVLIARDECEVVARDRGEVEVKHKLSRRDPVRGRLPRPNLAIGSLGDVGRSATFTWQRGQVRWMHVRVCEGQLVLAALHHAVLVAIYTIARPLQAMI